MSDTEIYPKVLSTAAVFGLLTWWVVYLYLDSFMSALTTFIEMMNGLTSFMWPAGVLLLFSTAVALLLSILFNPLGGEASGR